MKVMVVAGASRVMLMLKVKELALSFFDMLI